MNIAIGDWITASDGLQGLVLEIHGDEFRVQFNQNQKFGMGRMKFKDFNTQVKFDVNKLL